MGPTETASLDAAFAKTDGQEKAAGKKSVIPGASSTEYVPTALVCVPTVIIRHFSLNVSLTDIEDQFYRVQRKTLHIEWLPQ